MDCVCSKFGVDSGSRLTFMARTLTDTHSQHKINESEGSVGCYDKW